MARTLEAYAPNSLSSFTVKVIVSGAVTETITMAHVAAEPGTWRGTIAQAGSNGEAKLSFYWNGGTIEAGIFSADISATDGTTSYARELSLVQWPPRNATATANLSGTTVAAVSGAVGSVTGNVGGNVVGSVASVSALAANSVTASALASDAVAEIQSGLSTVTTSQVLAQVNAALTTAITEAYASDNADASVVQLLYEIRQNLTDFAISGTTKTVRKKDGSTTAATYTLDHATNPTSITRAT